MHTLAWCTPQHTEGDGPVWDIWAWWSIFLLPETNNDALIKFTLSLFKDAMPVSFDQNCLQWILCSYLSISKYYRKTTLLKTCVPQSWFCVDALLKQLNSLTSIDMFTWLSGLEWSRGNTSDWDARDPGFNSRLWQGFECLLCCDITFFVKTHHLSWNFAIPFALFIHLVYHSAKFVTNYKGIKIQIQHL